MSNFEQRSSSKRTYDNYSDGSDEYEEPVATKRSKQYSPSRYFSQRMEKRNAVIKYEHPIPENCAGLVIGRKGTEIMAISLKSQCQLQVKVDFSINGFRMVEIVGTPENIECAKKCIDELISRAVDRNSADSSTTSQSVPYVPHSKLSKITVEIPIPADKCGLVIGKKGENVRKLRTWSNCDINLRQEDSLANSTKPLIITGDRKCVEYAQKLVAEILTYEPEMMAGNGSFATMSLLVKVPRNCVGIIMGVQGSTIQKISENTKTKIQFLPDDDPKLMERSLMIIGKHSSVAVAAQSIKLIVESESAGANTQVALFYLSIPASKCGLVIGRGGEVIRQINAQSGAHCELSREAGADPMEKTFVIRGSDVQVEHAKHLIYMKVGDIPPNTPFVPRGAPQSQIQMHQSYPLQHQYSMQYQQPIPSWPDQQQQSQQLQQSQYLQPHFQPVSPQQNYPIPSCYEQPRTAYW